MKSSDDIKQGSGGKKISTAFLIQREEEGVVVGYSRRDYQYLRSSSSQPGRSTCFLLEGLLPLSLFLCSLLQTPTSTNRGRVL